MSSAAGRSRRLPRWALRGTTILAVPLLTALAASAAHEGARRAGEARPLPSRSRLVDVGGRRLHAFAYGSSSPAVVLLSGLSITQDYWNPVLPPLVRKTTVLTYDRAGVGSSEIGDRPTHGRASAQDLHVLLDSLHVPQPYILVGHSYGGSVARLFASLYPRDVGGLILEEVQHEDVLKEMRRVLGRQDLRTFEEVLAPTFDAPEHPRTEEDYRYVTREQLRSSRPLPRVPFVVLTCRDRARAMQPPFSDEAIAAIARLDSDLMSTLVASIPGGRQVLVEGTGHNVHVDRPEVLIAPVLEMIDDVRGQGGS